MLRVFGKTVPFRIHAKKPPGKQAALVFYQHIFMALLHFAVKFVKSHAYELAEGEQGDNVRKHHDTVEEVRQVPNKVDLEHGAEDQKDDDNKLIRSNRLCSEQILDVLFTEERPAQNSRTCEEEQTDGNKGAAERSEPDGEGFLSKSYALRHSIRIGSKRAGHKNDECRHIEHDKGIEENTDNGDQTLLGRIFNLCDSVRMRS